MVELCARAIEEWRGGGGVRAWRRSVVMARHAEASLGRGDGESEAERGE